jgi:mercuric reductase
MRIAVINKGLIGGTCVNVGCVPSKRLYHLAKEYARIKKISRNISHEDFNVSNVLKDIRKLISMMRRDKYERIIEGYGNVDRYDGEAFFKSHNRLGIKESDVELIGKKIIIATGSSPRIPNIPGLDEVEYLTSNNIWDLTEELDSIIVVGSGAIGLELSQALSRLGVKVTIIEMLDRIIPKTEAELSKALIDILREEDITIYLKSQLSKVESKNGGVRARIIGRSGEKTVEADKILLATGRKPNSDRLLLDNAGVKTDRYGRIIVDKYLRTNNPNIYAAGDVSSSHKPAYLETISAREGVIAASNIVEGDKFAVNHSNIPVVIFTDPELAFVGLTEEEVVNETGGCICRTVRFEDLAVSGIIGYKNGLAKLVANPYTRVVKGFHALAPKSSEFIGLASLMLKHNYKVEDVIESTSVFPTASEIIKLSAQAFIRNIKDMPCCVE